MIRLFVIFATCVVLSACGTTSKVAPSSQSASPPSSGKYYSNDGPPDVSPESLEGTQDAIPRAEPLHRFANRPYEVFGKQYVPYTRVQSFRETGSASWYGRKFQGQKTANGEIYDLYAMTAAHPTAPLPSYARVTNLENGRTVVVRINDRGPFLQGRIIDLSYAAAAKLGYARKGAARVEVELLELGDPSVLQPSVVTPPRVASESGDRSAITSSDEHFIQIGAFGNNVNAQSFLNKVSPEVSDALGIAPHVVERNGLSRVRVGPYRSRDAASAALHALSGKTGLSGVIGK
jgi:rare lipoprotein A